MSPTVTRLAPFVAAAVALLLVVVVPERGRDLGASTAAPATTTVVSTTTTTAVPSVVDDAAPLPGVVVSAAPPVAAATFSSPSPSPSPSTTTAAVAVAAARAPTPLLVAASGWASLRSGTPADSEVPDGGLPVGSAAGAEDKRSFVRLVGDETVLRLAVDAASTTSPEAGAIRACRIVEDWEPATGIALDDAPAHDDSACVDGAVGEDGSVWSFDLAAFPDRADQRGFALLPVPSSAVATFQITLRTS